VPRASPFVGLLFDLSRVGSLDRVVAPPYDTISPEQEHRLYRANPYNVVRLILARDEPDGVADPADRYARAARQFRRWEEAGVLVDSGRPAWFPYETRFTHQGERRRVRGLICQIELEPWGGSIIPHEATMASSVADRLNLLREVRANLSPVYALARGPSPPMADLLERVAASEPDRATTDDEGVEHRLWVLEDAPGVASWLANDQLLIADGHHRYSVALAYREEMRAAHGPGPWDHMMMLVVDAASEDPPVLPIHRVLMDGSATAHGRAAAHGRATASGPPVRDLAEILALIRDDDLTFGTASREDGGVVHRVGSLTGPPPTVCALHDQVLGQASVTFQPDAAAAEAAVLRGEAETAYFLPPTRVDRIRSVIERGERLPQKSTYFWPKPRTGMVIRPLR
jgi:uncharacterized protein (DUF1015 family)